MTFSQAVKTGFSKITDFNGRARRSEYWFYALGIFLITFVVAFVVLLIVGTDNQAARSCISILSSLALLSCEVRRLHDVGKSGWFILLALIPLVGSIILFVWCVTDSKPGDNQYGPNPKEIKEF